MIGDLISKLGGAAAVAKALDVSPWAIRKWGTVKVPGIPSKHWAALHKFSKGEISFEELAAARAPKRVKRAA